MIAIPGGMPESCDECRFAEIGGGILRCALDTSLGVLEGRDPSCPLREVQTIVSERADQPGWTGMAGRERLIAKEDLFRFVRDHHLMAEENEWRDGQCYFRLSISVVPPKGGTDGD